MSSIGAILTTGENSILTISLLYKLIVHLRHTDNLIKIHQVFFQYKGTSLAVNRKDLRSPNLVGLNLENPVLDPLAVLHLDN